MFAGQGEQDANGMNVAPTADAVNRAPVRRVGVDAALIGALVAGVAWDAAAQLAGCSRATVGRRLADPSFRAQLNDARAMHIERVTARLADASTLAVDTLSDVMSNSDLSASARVTAARAVLELAVRYRELVDLQTRLTALEARGDLSRWVRAAAS